MKQFTQADALLFLANQEILNPEGSVVFNSAKATGQYFILPGLDEKPMAEISYETIMFFLTAFKSELLPEDEAGNEYFRFPFATLHDTSRLEGGRMFMNLLPHLQMREPKQPRKARGAQAKKAE